MSKLKSPSKYFRLTLIFAFVVFLIMLTTMLLTYCGAFLLSDLGILEGGDIAHAPLFLFCLASIAIGTVLALAFSRATLRPLRELMAAADKIADGDYSVRLDLKGPEEWRALGEKFNHMAEKIGSVEMLQTDFVNSFSHEFKTPIVSIRGFAKALKWEGLTSEERSEYLDIIISEAERLSSLSANVLYLSKIENQTILTDKRRFNLSEQIRLVIALLDQKLAGKNLEVIFDNRECYVVGNDEMLKQVWINLLDNAIKFSPIGGQINVVVKEMGDSTTVQVQNRGEEIPLEAQAHIFDKFYQGDRSHSTEGNGLGLAIVKKIVDLHDGEISVHSSGEGNIFEVTLNNQQAGDPLASTKNGK